MNKVVLSFLRSAFAAVNASAAVLYSPTVISASPRSSDYGSVSGSGFRTFDIFTLAESSFVERATWSALWFDGANPDPAPAPSPDVTTWEISFYADNAGTPGTLLSSLLFAPASVTSTFQGNGVLSAGGTFNAAFYEYAVDLTSPFSATAGAQYWISILARSDNFYPAFAWRGATGGDDSSYQQTLGAGESVQSATAVARDRAVVLEGSSVPEPGTFGLVAGALLLLPLANRLRRR